MSTNKALADFAAALLSGSVKIVDLTAPLGPNTPVLYLPARDRQEHAGGKGARALALRPERPVLGMELA